MFATRTLLICLVAVLSVSAARAEICGSGYRKIVELGTSIPVVNECDILMAFNHHFDGRVTFASPLTGMKRSLDGKPLVSMVFVPDTASIGVNVVAHQAGQSLKAAKAGFETDVGRMVCEISDYRDFLSAGGVIQMKVVTTELSGGLDDLSPLSSVVTSCEAT